MTDGGTGAVGYRAEVPDGVAIVGRWLAQEPAETVVLVDFDGTLAPIVADHDAARLPPGLDDLLVRAASRVRLLAVVSGRPASFLSEALPAGIDFHGLYGLEGRVDGRRIEQPGLDRWRSVVAEFAESAVVLEMAFPGVRVESKGASLTVHYRGAEEMADEVVDWCRRHAEGTGLEVRPAKRSVELHPAGAVDKGTVVTELCAGASSVVYIGDDLGDLPAFDALGDLAAAGRRTLAVVVDSAELAPQVSDRADVTLSGPAEVGEVLAGLVAPA